MYDRLFRAVLIRRGDNGKTPEGQLAAAVIAQAFEDAWVGDSYFLDGPEDAQEQVPTKADAESFFVDGRLEAWCVALGIAPNFVRGLRADTMSRRAMRIVESRLAA